MKCGSPRHDAQPAIGVVATVLPVPDSGCDWDVGVYARALGGCG